MRKKLLLALVWGVFSFGAWAQDDVTAQYILNPSFELTEAGTAGADVIGLDKNTGPYGWSAVDITGGTSATEEIKVANSSFVTQFGSTSPSDGERYYYIHKKNANQENKFIKATSREPLPRGRYFLTVDYKQAEDKDQKNSQVGLKVEAQGNVLSECSIGGAAANQGGEYFTHVGWKRIGVWFEVTEEEGASVDISLTFSLMAPFKFTAIDNQRLHSALCLDNVRLYKWSPDNQTNYDNATKEHPLDMTASVVTNPYFDSDVEGWTSTTGAAEHKRDTKAEGALSGGFLQNWDSNNAIGQGRIYQELSGLPAGTYRLTASVLARVAGATTGADVALYIGQNKTIVTDGDTASDYVVQTIVSETGTLEIGLEVGLNNKATWIGLDNVRLEYLGLDVTSALEEAQAEVANAEPYLSRKCNEAEKTTLREAIAAVRGLTTAAKFKDVQTASENLTKALNAVMESVAAYEHAATVLPKMEELTGQTNVYSKEALDAYYTQWADKYENNTLTTDEGNALENPFERTDAKVDVAVDDFLLSVWDTAADFNDYYIDTWSTDAMCDATHITTPFFEYWVDDDKSKTLAPRTLTATLTDVEPGDYYVDVLAFVRIKDRKSFVSKYDSPQGISLSLNEGEPTDLCGGNNKHDTRGFYDTFRAYGTVKDDGVLAIKIEVTNDNTIQWLAFKNMRYVKAASPEQKAELTAAIASAEEVHKLGFEDGEYAPYNNIEALDALAAAKAMDLTGVMPQEDVVAAAAALNNATWTANSGDVDAIYNGHFTEPNGTNPKGWTRSNGAWGQQITGLDSSTGAEAGAAWYYNTPGAWEYGKDGNYQMPLAANTAYKLTFKYRSHETDGNGKGSNNWMKAAVGHLDSGVQVLETAQYPQNADDRNFLTVTATFTTDAEAGNYVLSLEQSGNTHLTDVSLVKATGADMTLSEQTAYMPAVHYYQTLTLERTLKADTWNTFVLPFDVDNTQLRNVFGEDVAIAEYSETVDGNMSTVSFQTMEVPAIAANTPVLLKTSTAGSSYTLDNCLTRMGEARTAGAGNFDFVGTYEASVTIPENDYFISNNQLYRSKGTTKLKGTRAYLHNLGDADTEVKLFIDGLETAIDAVGANRAGQSRIYDLSGRRVSGSRKGIYIIDGRKTIVK